MDKCETDRATEALVRALAIQPGALHFYDDLARLWGSRPAARPRMQPSVDALNVLTAALQREGRSADAHAVEGKSKLFRRGGAAGAAGLLPAHCG